MTLAGPFRFMGLIGISAYKAVIQDLLVELSCETKVPPLMQKVVGSGAMGVAKAEGFYDYTPERAKRWEEVFLKLVMKFARSRKGIPKMSVIKGRRTMEFTYNQASRREFIGSALAAGASAARLRGASVIPLAPTPQMGWMSWNQFGQDVSEELVRETADILVNSGMKTLGYRYLDSTITGRAAATARSIPIRNAFPRESRLLPIMCTPSVYGWASMLGIYSDAAGNTCEGQPGSFGNEERDAKTFASRGIDYLKYDYCHVPEDQETAIRRYSTMSAALRNTGRPIVFSICEWGPRQPWLWGGKAGGQLWRTTWDIRDIWKGSFDDTACGILDIIDHQAGLNRYAGPGGWNDPDMLVVGLYGNGRYTSPKGYPAPNDIEYRRKMSMWCMMASPLMVTCDLRKMNAATREILTNPEILSVHQDPLGKQAARVLQDGDREVWKKPRKGGALAIALLNRNDGPKTIRARWNDFGITGKRRVRDLWQRTELGVLTDFVELEVSRHGTVALHVA